MSDTDIKMSEWFSGNAIKVGNGISDDHGIIVLEGYKWAVLAAIKAINNHDPMALRIKELEFSLDDRDCYIADADMKIEGLAKRAVELEAALNKIKQHHEVMAGGDEMILSQLAAYRIANEALGEE